MNFLAAAAEILLGHRPQKMLCETCGAIYIDGQDPPHGCNPEERVTDTVQAARAHFLMPMRSGRARAKGYSVT